MESGIQNFGIQNPKVGIQNPDAGIRNPGPSWILLHGASFKMYLYTFERREATRREYVVPLPKVWPLYNMLDISSGSY